MTPWAISFFVSSGGFMKEYKSVTLSKFLSRFLAVDGMALTKVTHADVKMLFPMLKRASFEYVEKHPEEVMMGRIIMVNDGKKVIPYIVPDVRKIEIDITMMPEFVEEKRNGKREIDYTKMRVYELKRLLNLRFNTYKVSRGARNELENRGVLLKRKYKRAKKIELEEE